MNNTTRLQLIEGPQSGFLDIKEGVNVPLNFSISDIRDISSRSGMFSKTIALSGSKNNNDILNNYFDVNIVAGTFDVNKRQKVAIVQNGIILRDNCYMRLLKVKKKQAVDTNVDEWVEYEVQVTDELGDFFKEVGNKEVKELDGWSKYNHIYGVDAVVDSFDHTVDDGYKYTLPWIKREDGLGYDYTMNDLMPGVYAKQIFDRIHMLNGFSYDWATMTDDDTQFDKSILPYAGDKKKLTEEYIESVKVIADNLSTQETVKKVLGNGVNNGFIPSTPLSINNEIKDNSNWYDHTTSIYSNSLIVEPPNSLNYIVKINYDIVFVNDYTYDISLTQAFQRFTSNLRIVNTNGSILKHTNRLPLEINPANSSVSQYGTSGDEIRISHLIGQSWNTGETVVASGNETFNIPITNLVGTEELRIEVNANMNNSAGSQWRRTGTFDAVDMKMKIIIKSIEIEIAPDSQNGLMPGTEIDIKNFLPTKMKQSDFLKTIYQKYNLYVEIDPDNPSRLIYTSRDKFYDDGEIKDWTEKLDKKREQELYFIPDITTKKMILSYKDDDKDSLLSAYRGETSKTFGQVDVTFDNENIKGEERKEEVFSPTINMMTDFDAVLPVFNADFKMNPRILQDGGKLPCQTFKLKESDNKTVTSSFYPHLSMFDKPFNPNFSIEYAQSSYYAYNPGLFTENNLYTSHWRRTLAQINDGKMLKAWFWLTEEDIQGLKMNDKIKLNNTFYYINAIIDYDANSNSVTKVELLTVEDDLKLPRVGGGIKNIGSIVGVVSGTLRPRTPSISGGFFTGVIADVIKKRYDESVVVSGPTSLTGNLGMGNTLPFGFRGVVIGDNLLPTQDGIFVGEGTQITESGVKSNSLEVPGLTISEDGDIEFTGNVDFSGAVIPELDAKEDKSNKVQDLSNPDSTTYPSTNAVKNALNSKVESVTGTGVDNTDPKNPTISIDKHTIGLGNVDNIQQIPLADKGANNGVAELDSGGKIPISQLPSYVSDVEVYNTLSSFPIVGEDGVIYITEDTNLTYRWTGSAYAEISPSIALGETSSTAYRGDRGKIAYDHSQLTSGNPHNVTKSDVGLSNVDNTSDINKPISTATQTALNGKVDKKQSVNGMDMNSITQPGFYYGYNMTNAAVTTISTFMVMNYSIDWIIQKQFVPSGSGNREFMRSRHDGTTWSPWKEITLDGVESISRVSGWLGDGVNLDNTDPKNPKIGLQDRLPLSFSNPNNDENPKWYMDNYTDSRFGEIKRTVNLGMQSIFPYSERLLLITDTHINQQSTGYMPLQTAIDYRSGRELRRYATSNTTWSPWKEVTLDGVQSVTRENSRAPVNLTNPKSPIILEQKHLPVQDTRSDNEPPSFYLGSGRGSDVTYEFKFINTIGVGSIFTLGTYCSLETICQWGDASGGYPFQIAKNPADGKMAKRYGVSATTWSNWQEIGAGGGGGSMTIFPITYSNLRTLRNTNALSPGVRYFISDRDIWIDALDSNKLAMECKRHFRIVKDTYYTPVTFGTLDTIGIYGQKYTKGSTPNSTTSLSRIAIWGGRVWRRNNSGVDTPGTSNETIAGGWTLQPITNNTYYESKIFDIKYNFDDDIIWEQSDDRGNKIKRANNTFSLIDVTDWGNVDIYNNENFGVFNNFRNATTRAVIYDNSNSGFIRNNSNSGNIYDNSNSGGIFNNSNSGFIRNNSNSGDIILNSNSGDIILNSNSGDIILNSNNGIIRDNSNTGNINNNSNRGYINNNSNIGNIYDNSNVSGTTNIRSNRNNGYISGNRMNGSYLFEYNTNNGDIGVASGTITRNANIRDNTVNK